MSLLSDLLEVAGEQRGFVTPQDAARVGVPRVELPKMAARGVLEHRSHGVYRIPNFPVRRHDDLMEATLWAGGEGTISHESALELWGLADVNPRKINLTVGRRVRRAHGEAYRVWVAELPTADIDQRDDIPVTTVQRSILDAAATGTDRQLIDQAIRNAERYDLIGVDEIKMHPWPPTIVVRPVWPRLWAAIVRDDAFPIDDIQEAARPVQSLISRIDTSDSD